jgi:hypothetical protein
MPANQASGLGLPSKAAAAGRAGAEGIAGLDDFIVGTDGVLFVFRWQMHDFRPRATPHGLSGLKIGH